MTIRKVIYTQPDDTPDENGMIQATVHIMQSYTQGHITDYQRLAKQMRETFPQATDAEVTCGEVTKSTYCQGATLLQFKGLVESKSYDSDPLSEGGWRHIANRFGCDYIHTAN